MQSAVLYLTEMAKLKCFFKFLVQIEGIESIGFRCSFLVRSGIQCADLSIKFFES